MFGLMRTKTHRKMYVKQGQAYRREIQEAQRGQRDAERRLREWVRDLVPDIRTQRAGMSDNLMVMVEVSPHLQRIRNDHELIQWVGREITNRLYGIAQPRRDPRGDLRQTEAERARASLSLHV